MPLSLLDHLQQTWLLFVSRWRTFVKISLVISLPFIVQTVVQNINDQAPWWPTVGLILLSAIVQIWGTLALIITADSPTVLDVNQAFEKTSSKIWPFFLTGLTVALLTIIGLVLLIIPGLYLAIALSFASLFLALETNSVKVALKNSRALVIGRWWLVFWRFIVLIFLTMIFSGLLGSLFTLLLDGLSPTILQSILLLPIMLLVGPLTVLYNYVLYKNLKKLQTISHELNVSQ